MAKMAIVDKLDIFSHFAKWPNVNEPVTINIIDKSVNIVICSIGEGI